MHGSLELTMQLGLGICRDILTNSCSDSIVASGHWWPWIVYWRFRQGKATDLRAAEGVSGTIRDGHSDPNGGLCNNLIGMHQKRRYESLR